MKLKIKRTINRFFGAFKEALSTLLTEHGVRAEFQSSLGLILLFIWFNYIPHVEPVEYINAVDKFMSHGFFGWILLVVGLFQAYSNIGDHPKERLIAAFIACLAWSTFVVIGFFASLNFLVVPLATTFAVVQALVFIHLEAVEE